MSGPQAAAYRREVQAILQDPFAVYNPFYKVDRVFYMAIKNFKLARSLIEARPDRSGHARGWAQPGRNPGIVSAPVERWAAPAPDDRPQHTYTKLLISSIPIPDPDARWQDRLQIPEELASRE